MIVTPVKTHKITDKDKDITKVIEKYIHSFPDRSVLGIAAKIVSICEGRIIPIDKADKDELIARESQYYTSREENPWGVSMSIAHNSLAASAGIDESNAFGHYVLWPANPQKSANQIREFLVKKFGVRFAGVVIVDGHTQPFRWGVMGISLAHSGFEAIKWNHGKKDLFGREIKISNQNVCEGLAASASVVMGEAGEPTPLALISKVPFINFQDRDPNKQELDAIRISPEEDLYWPLLKNAPWKKGKK